MADLGACRVRRPCGAGRDAVEVHEAADEPRATRSRRSACATPTPATLVRRARREARRRFDARGDRLRVGRGGGGAARRPPAGPRDPRRAPRWRVVVAVDRARARLHRGRRVQRRGRAGRRRRSGCPTPVNAVIRDRAVAAAAARIAPNSIPAAELLAELDLSSGRLPTSGARQPGARARRCGRRRGRRRAVRRLRSPVSCAVQSVKPPSPTSTSSAPGPRDRP